MSKRIQKSTGLVGITTLMNQNTLDPKVNLQKTEEQLLGGGGEEKNSNDSASTKSKKGNLDEIYKLAKDLDIKIDGLGPDNVTNASKSVRPLAEKLENLSDSSRSKSSRSTISKRSRSKHSGGAAASRSKKSYRIPADQISISTGSTASVKRPMSYGNLPPPPPQNGYGYSPPANKYEYPPPMRMGKQMYELTEEQKKKEHIDGVICNIRNETRNTFSTDMERAQDNKASKIEQIASIKMALSEEGIDTAMIPTPLMSSSMEEIDSTLNLLLMKNNRYRYSTLAEEVISAGAEVLESVFDGSRTVPIFNVTPDYTGLMN